MNMIRSAKEEERRKVLEGRQDVEFKRNQAEQGEKDDPASVVSKQYQSLAAQYLGKKPEEFAGLSATKLGTILPVVERSYAVKENADAKRDAAKTAADARGITLGEKDSQFNQKEFDKIISDNNPNNAQSRTSIGMIGRANLNADRALTTLMKPTVTKQEAGNVMADIAGIYQGGSPTTLGMKEQEYNTVYGSLKNTLQSLTGKPQDALPDDIKARLIATLRDMKATNAAIIKRNLDTTAAAKGRILKHFPDEWKAFREQVEGGSAPADSAPTTGGANAQSGPYGPEVEKDGKTYVWSAATGKYHPK